MSPPAERSTGRLRDLTDRLLVRDAEVHAAAVEELAAAGDERVVPHLLEVLIVDSIANDWERFGFPTVLRERDPPRYLELPEVRWPGARDALATLADPDFDSPHAWVEWETWYSQQSIDPLAGFEEWKLRLYRSYLPPVGGLLDCGPREFDLQDVRWGNCDRSFLAALNGPEFVAPGSVDDPAGEYPAPDDTVFGFELGGTAYAVPRWMLFPHELLNADLGGQPVSLTYCTLCNAPILYDRRIDGAVRTFGSSGMLLAGNKVMYDEETESLWDQHAGVPVGGPHLAEDPDLVLDQFAVTQTDWDGWVDEHPETLVLDPDTGYGYEYGHYRGNVDFFEHYWTNERVVQPGIRREDGALPEKARVYGVVSEDVGTVWVVPEDDLDDGAVLVGDVDGDPVVSLRDRTGDVAVYEAPPTPVEWADGDLVDADGTRWTVGREELRSEIGERRERIVGRHGLWFAFRTHYDEAHVLGCGER